MCLLIISTNMKVFRGNLLIGELAVSSFVLLGDLGSSFGSGSCWEGKTDMGAQNKHGLGRSNVKTGKYFPGGN